MMPPIWGHPHLLQLCRSLSGEANAMRKSGSQATQVVLITGCSSGIGKAICERLKEGNFSVYGGSRNACAAQGWTHVTMDVTDDSSVQVAIDEIARREARIDAVVTCAGVGLAGPVEETTIE